MFLQIHEPGQTPLPHSHVRAVGIDLGTTNSVIAVSEKGNVEVLRNTHGHALIPSVVYYEDAVPQVGYSALAQVGKKRGVVIRSVKRLMNQGALRLKIPGREITPVEVSADILRHLKQHAEAALGHEVKQAVITVPAYFDESARQATKDAAQLAGLEALRIISEPTAAALAYGLDEGAEGIYAVYDLGGGTFDISLLRLEKGVFQVLATGGDTQLGGDDFDSLLLEYALKQAGIEKSSAEWDYWLLKARAAKEALSESAEAFLVLENDKITITRAVLEKLITPLVEKTLHIAGNAMRDAKVEWKDVKGVVLVGGSTRVPLVRRQVEKLFQREAEKGVDPDLVVAAGAARQAEALTQGGDHLLLDVIPLSLGLETMGGLVEKLVHRNTPIPVSISQEFTTWQDGQTGMHIHVVQGEREMVSQNRSLAKFELKNIPPLPAGIARVKVTFTVDADGLLTVTAAEEGTGTMQEVHVKPSYGLALKDIEKMLEESMRHAKQDITERLLAEARIEAQRVVIELESAMKQDAALLTVQEVEKLAKNMELVKKYIAGRDRDAIDNAVQNLAEASQAFAERRMNSAIAKALQGHAINEWEKPEA